MLCESPAAAPPLGEVCPEVCPVHAIACPRRIFIITDFPACVAEQRKHSTVDRASLMGRVGASPIAGMMSKFNVQRRVDACGHTRRMIMRGRSITGNAADSRPAFGNEQCAFESCRPCQSLGRYAEVGAAAVLKTAGLERLQRFDSSTFRQTLYTLWRRRLTGMAAAR